jgi:hypothetical protein
MTTIWADLAGHGVKETYIDAGGLWTRRCGSPAT